MALEPWCEHGFEFHSQTFLLTYLGLIKAYHRLDFDLLPGMLKF